VSGYLTDIGSEELTLEITATDGGDPSLSQTRDLLITISKDMPGPPRSNRMLALLASEDLAIILALTLATILVAIAIIVSIIFLARKRRSIKQTIAEHKEEWFGSGDIQLKEANFDRRYSYASGTTSTDAGTHLLYGSGKVTALEASASTHCHDSHQVSSTSIKGNH